MTMTAKVRKTKGTPSNIDVHVGKRLQVRRSLLGWSQEKLGDAIGLTFQQIQKYEKGLNRISAGRLYQFSQILTVPIEYFYDNMESASNKIARGLSDNDQDAFTGPDIMQEKETVDLIRVYYSIKNPELRKDVVKFMKSMAKSAESE